MQLTHTLPHNMLAIVTAGLLYACAAPSPNPASGSSDNTPQAGNTTNRALLIGIGDYTAPVPQLDGPPYDLAVLTAVLPQWGFAAPNITVLKDHQASRAGVLEALQTLADAAQPGDNILIYFSGHGTSDLDQNFGQTLALPYTSGALVPADFTLNAAQPEDLVKQLIVGRSDLRPQFATMDRKGAHVLAIFDACYSGNTIRDFQAAPALQPRRIDLSTIGGRSFARVSAPASPSSSTANHRDPYPYRNVIYLGAASEDQTASDIGGEAAQATVDGKPHGAFTDMLLRILRGEVVADTNGDGTLSPAELQAVLRPLVSQKYPQTPQMLPGLRDDTDHNENRGFFVHTSGTINAPPAPPPEFAATLRIWIDQHIFGMATTKGLARIQGVTASTGANKADLQVVRKGAEMLLLLPNNHPLARYPNGEAANLQNIVAQQAAAQPLRNFHPTNAEFSLQLERSGSSADGIAVEGSLVGFSVRAPRAVYYLAVDINPHGQVSVLYPDTEAELAPIPANQVVDLGGQIRVTSPFGTDYVKVFALSQPPATFKQWIRQTDIAPSDPRFSDLACLVGLAIPGHDGPCATVGTSEATFTVSTYPQSEVVKY